MSISNDNIAAVLTLVRKANRAKPGAVVNQYVETPYTVLISCILSLRTQDKTTDLASQRLFELAKTPQEMIRLPLTNIRKAIYPVGFYNVKAKGIQSLSRMLIEQHGGRVPDTLEGLLELPGVGRKTANLTLTLGYRKLGICVDTHVHRICHRWDYVRAKSPDETEMALRQKLPKRYWIELNELLVTFGQNICQPVSPRCSICPLRTVCPRIDVKHSR